MLQAAQSLNCDIIYGVYSGDENCGLMIVPKNLAEHSDPHKLQQAYKESCRLLTAQTYKQDSHPLAKEYSAMQEVLNNAGKEKDAESNLELGFRLYTTPLNDQSVHKPSSHTHLRARTLAAAAIDIAEGKHPRDTGVSLVDELFNSLGKSGISPIEQDKIHDQDILSHASHKLVDMYHDAVVAGMSKQKALILLEKAYLESITPRSLWVRKKYQLFEDISDGVQEGKKYRLITLANTRVKMQNKSSHLLGDNEIIATPNIIQRYIKSTGHDPHIGIRYYKSEGSLLLLVDDSNWDTVSSLLEDVLAINNFSNQSESQRTLRTTDAPSFRANPFIVTSLSNLLIDQNTTKQFLATELDHLKVVQIEHEILYTLHASAVANRLPSHLISLITEVLSARGRKTASIRQLLDTSRLSQYYLHVFAELIEPRKERLHHSMQILGEQFADNLRHLITRAGLHQPTP